MNKYEKQVIKQLNSSAAKEVKGSEYGVGEHVFGIAAEIIEEKDKELEAKNSEIKKLQATPCTWCNKTSAEIDSLEFELETKDQKIKELSNALVKHLHEEDKYIKEAEKQHKNGFWLGYEDARCFPAEHNILQRYELLTKDSTNQ